jgi:hypothetical protein
MKSRLLFVPLLAVAVTMTASTAFAAPTSKATPLKGSWDSSEIPTFVPAPPPDAVTMYVDGDASGNATHLGKYIATFEATVNLACNCSVGDTVHFIAANGDSLYGVGAGSGIPSDTPGYTLVTQFYAITGGTGRFAGATGNFTVTRLINMATAVSKGSIDGTIVLAPDK